MTREYKYLGSQPIICGSSERVITSGVQPEVRGSTPRSRTNSLFSDTLKAIGYGLLIGTGLGAIALWMWGRK